MTRDPLTLGWTVALLGTAALAALAVVPAVVGGEVGAFVHRAFAGVCHQIPDRSPHLFGEAVALCHRCSGMLLGLVGGIAATPLLAGAASRTSTVRQGRLLALAALPTALDWLLGAAGLWANTPASRTLTGALFGAVAGAVLASNVLTGPRPAPSPSPTS